MMFKKYTGSPIAILNTLKPLRIMLRSSLTAQTKDAYLEQVGRDLDRIRYFNDKHSIAEIQHRLRDISHLYDDEARRLKDRTRYLSYTQGDFDASIFTELYVKNTAEYLNTMVATGKKNKEYCDSLGLCYVDDNGVLCGLSITYFRNIDANHKADFSKLPFTVSIIRHSNSALIDREVTSIIHPNLLSLTTPIDGEPTKALPLAKSSDVDEQDVIQALDQALNSKNLSQLLKRLVIGESISRIRFDELQQKFLLPKSKLLEGLRLATLGQRTEEKDKLMLALMILINKINEDTDYAYRLTLNSIQQLINDVERSPIIAQLPKMDCSSATKEGLIAASETYTAKKLTIETELKKKIAALHDSDKDHDLNQSVFKRHFGSIVSAGVGLLATSVGLMLFLGALPFLPVLPVLPLVGLALIAVGLATTLISGLVAVINEVRLNHYQKKLTNEVFQLQEQHARRIKPTHVAYEQSVVERCRQLTYPAALATDDDSKTPSNDLSAQAADRVDEHELIIPAPTIPISPRMGSPLTFFSHPATPIDRSIREDSDCVISQT